MRTHTVGTRPYFSPLKISRNWPRAEANPHLSVFSAGAGGEGVGAGGESVGVGGVGVGLPVRGFGTGGVETADSAISFSFFP